MLRRIILICLLFISFEGFSQRDSIIKYKKQLAFQKDDTALFNSYNKLSESYNTFENEDSILHFVDSAIFFAKKANGIAIKLERLDMQAIALRGVSISHQISGNYTKALEFELKILSLYEKTNDSIGIAYTKDNLGAIYDDLNEINLSIKYQKEAYAIYKELNYTVAKLEIANHIGYAYTLLNMPDSALPYFHEAYTITRFDDEYSIREALPFALYGLGKVNLQYGNYSIALPYFIKALELSKKSDFYVGTWYKFIIYIGIADVYSKTGKINDAIRYYEKSINTISKDKLTADVYFSLSELIKNSDPSLAYSYIKKGVSLRDSLFSAKNKIVVQNIIKTENERQLELQKSIQEAKIEREHNIQYMAIGIFIISFIILFLLLSRTILVKPRVIKVLGVIVLLITFEFINLLLHPFLEKITHHSPFLMLICLAILASLIVPVHHWLEKWVTLKVVKKNELIRIDLAKRILNEGN